MAQQGLKQDDQGNWINYNISDSKDIGWNDSIINAKLEKNVDSGPKRSVFTADTVKNEIDTDPYNGAYDDYIPWWLQKDGEDGNDNDNNSRSRTTVDPLDPFFKKRDSLASKVESLDFDKDVEVITTEHPSVINKTLPKKLPGFTTQRVDTGL